MTDVAPPLDDEVELRQSSALMAAEASQWRLMGRRFLQHRLAVVGGVIVLLIYLIALFAEFIAPYDPNSFSPQYTYAPPQAIHLFGKGPDGSTTFAPHVNGYRISIDRARAARVFLPDESKPIPVGMFVKSKPYEMWGLFTLERKLFGSIEPGAPPVYIFGADRLGRDIFSRTIHGARVSMTVGLIGVTLSLLIGVVLGSISGYIGGVTDSIIQRAIEFILSLPTIPLWLGLAAALPKTWSPLTIYFCITVILSLVGWTSLARVVRSRFLSLRNEDFVTAAELDGCRSGAIMFRHLLPAIYSHIIASTTLAIPAMILAETSLSFLGLGLQPPIVSWGVLLQEAQSIRAIATAPWLFIPGVAVVIAVLALNFLGDGLRDAADPYA